MNGATLWKLAAAHLQARARRTGTIEVAGVPKLVQQMAFFCPVLGFYVLLFSGDILFVAAEQFGLGLFDTPSEQHYHLVEAYVLELEAAGFLVGYHKEVT